MIAVAVAFLARSCFDSAGITLGNDGGNIIAQKCATRAAKQRDYWPEPPGPPSVRRLIDSMNVLLFWTLPLKVKSPM